MIKPFEISVLLNNRRFTMQVKCVYEGPSVERFEIAAGGKAIMVQTDYNYIKKNKVRKSPDWKIISGEVKSGAGFALTILEIERHFKGLANAEK